MTYSVGIVGLGNMGFLYDEETAQESVYSHAKGFSNHPDFELKFGVDLSDERRALYSSKYGVDAFTSLEEVNDKNIDVIVISTPTTDRLELVKKVVAMKPKVLVIEKPLANTFKEALEIQELIKNEGIEVFVNYPRRCDPSSLEIKKKINDGSLGQPLGGTILYSRGFMNSASHYVDLLCFWFGDFQELVKVGDNLEEVLCKFNGNTSFLIKGVADENLDFGEMRVVFSKGILEFKEQGSQIELFSMIENKVTGRNKFDSNPVEIKNDLERYQLNVVDHIGKILSGSGENVSSLSTSLNLLEKLG